MGDAYAKICKTGQQTRDPKKSWCCGIEFKGNLEAEFSLPWGPQGFPRCLDDKESACNAGDLGAIPGLGRSPGEGSSYPLQYSVLENSMHCVVHRVSKSQTWLSDFHLGSPGFSFESFCQQQTGTYQDHCQWLNNKGICHLSHGQWTPCYYSCWPSTTPEGAQGRVRRSVLQGIWWDRSLDSRMFLGTDFIISILASPHI